MDPEVKLLVTRRGRPVTSVTMRPMERARRDWGQRCKELWPPPRTGQQQIPAPGTSQGNNWGLLVTTLLCFDFTCYQVRSDCDCGDCGRTKIWDCLFRCRSIYDQYKYLDTHFFLWWKFKLMSSLLLVSTLMFNGKVGDDLDPGGPTWGNSTPDPSTLKGLASYILTLSHI